MDKADITAKYDSDGDRTPIHEEHTIDSAKHVSDTLTDPDAGKSDEERAAIVCKQSTSTSIIDAIRTTPTDTKRRIIRTRNFSESSTYD